MQRREFLRTGVLAAACGVSRLPAAESHKPEAPAPLQERIALFTDHLDDHGYGYADIARMLAPLKIAGPDLTVRGGGVVPPDRVAEELPRAFAAFRDAGMSVPMISTQLSSANDMARATLATMDQLGIRYFKLGYYHYHDLRKWDSELDAQRKELAGLVELARRHSVVGGLHNHSGAAVGGPLWDGWEFLRPLDPAHVGFYFDPAHASIEGARFAWKLNLQRMGPRVKMVALKDYVWERTAGGWQTRWVPLGEGMVDWSAFFRLLRDVPFEGPLSIHIEYDPGGSTKPERIDRALAAAQKDVAFVRKHLGGPVGP